jgi:hypothetical protein
MLRQTSGFFAKAAGHIRLPQRMVSEIATEGGSKFHLGVRHL